MRKTALPLLIFLLLAGVASADSLFDLAKSGSPAQVQAALNAGAKADRRDADGETPLMYAAVFNRDPEVIRILVAAGAGVGDRDKDGHTALMWAARNNASPGVIFALVKAGAAVGDRNRNGATALMLAAGDKTNPALDPNLTLTIAMHDALRLFSLAYSLDPIPVLTPNKNVVDFIQFPRQTLDNRSGKCSDLSVLYSSLLEAVGVETAFITTPGHMHNPREKSQRSVLEKPAFR